MRTHNLLVEGFGDGLSNNCEYERITHIQEEDKEPKKNEFAERTRDSIWELLYNEDLSYRKK